MDGLRFVRMMDRQQAVELSGMMAELYREDPPATGQISSEYFERTISRLLQHPDQGRILFFQNGSDICGYSLLVPYWSNEYGGVLLFVDELYVKPAFRNRGFGTAFLNHIAKHCPDGTARICLEVSHRNTKARALYESLGFVARPYSTMALEPSRPGD